ncbi:MAG: glycosyltransferase family 2 protein [Prevotella salivae]|uniref:glycosyltransferase family 2 protein n=1 Tax=Segatella salivae TaxID=228604 RepID=UPI001CB1690F|nr:glycosyltransferase family 2 protein [Segatella salivae]MBF1523900.1 glycosyltransferase family 2 protein [Segatella salivae]
MQNKKHVVDCFIPMASAEALNKTLAGLQNDELVNRIIILQTNDENITGVDGVLKIDTLKSSDTMRKIAMAAEAPYTLVYMKEQYMEMGLYALERMVRIADYTDAVMTYADHYNISAEGLRSEAPVIDYQQGSLRDDFDFGSVLLFRTDALKAAAKQMTESYQAAGFYDLRLKLSVNGRFEHINEYLYSEVELDNRKTGEKLFDYVDPRNRASQIEMEAVATNHLKAIGAYLKPEFKQVDLKAESFPVEASIMIPVRNRIRTIRDAIESALSQKTNFKYNVFIVENGPDYHSTDGTTEAIEEYKDDERVVHLIPNRRDIGVGGSWNMAANHPQCGRFIVQLDSDDVYSDEHTLQKFVDAFYEQQCAMVIGTYMLTDINRQMLPPGKIDHREWTPENGRNNALRINGLGAPRAFFTPILREVKLPNVNYGEDYALGLAISRDYQIGRIYDVLYYCRRWDDNSDAALSVEKENRNNTYKDRIRTWELLARLKKNKEQKD